MDVDVVSPGAEVHGDERAGVGMEQDLQSEEIVKQLERGLP
jgi:chromatin structure-remodeling complex subunit RSC1/2